MADQETETKAAKPVDYSKQFEELKAENARLAEQAKSADAKAEKASGLLQRMLSQLETVANQQPVSDSKDGKDPITKLKELYDEDPIAAMNQLFNARVAPLMEQTLQNQAGPNRDAAKQRAKEVGLSEYDDEVEKFMDAMPADVRAKPGAYDAAYRYIAANHIDDIVDKRVKEQHERASRVEGATGADASKPTKPTLDPMEKEVMKALGVGEDDWLKYKDTQSEVPAKAKPEAEEKAA